MELAQIYEMLNGVEGGADAVASLKKEFTTLRNEAKENRISKEEILKALNLQNGEAGKQQAETLSALAERLRQANTTPADMLSKMNALEKSITDLTAKYEARTKEAEAEKHKRIATATRSQLISALSKGNAVNPEQYATLPALTGAIVVGDDDTLGFKSGDKTVSIADGVNAWLKARVHLRAVPDRMDHWGMPVSISAWRTLERCPVKKLTRIGKQLKKE